MARRPSDFVADQKIVLHIADYGFDFLRRMNKMRTDGLFTDIVLCVGQEEFPCHKLALAVSSPYFQAMFSSDLRESQEGKINISGVSPWIMKRILEYAYTGKTEISVENAQDMLAAGNLFEYRNIVDACCDFLRQHLQPSNCLGIENFARYHDCFVLATDAHRYVLDNFSSVIEHEEFLELNLQSLLAYLNSDLIDVRSEQTVYLAAMKWVQHNLETRASFLFEVLKEVRLVNIDHTYLETVIKTDPLISKNPECRFLVKQALHEPVNSTNKPGFRRQSIPESVTQPRPSTVAKEVMVVVGGVGSSILTSVEMYEPHKDKWTYLPELPCALSCMSVCAYRNDIYVTGGISEGNIVDSVYKFDSKKYKWRSCPSLRLPRARHSSAVCDCYLYVLGGENASQMGDLVPAEKIERFNSETEQWQVIGDYPFPRKHSVLVPYGEFILEVGGIPFSGPSKTRVVDTYSCRGGILKYSGEQIVLPEIIEYAQIAELEGTLYIIWEDQKQLIALDPQKKTYKSLQKMRHGHIYSGATVVNKKIYISAGMDKNKPTSQVECYDPVLDKWSVVRSMRHSRSHHGCVTICIS